MSEFSLVQHHMSAYFDSTFPSTCQNYVQEQTPYLVSGSVEKIRQDSVDVCLKLRPTEDTPG